MTDAYSGASKYSGNSNRDKAASDIPEKKVEKIVSGSAVERKKPLARRIAENFTGADAQSVGHYVLFDVILPQFKDMIYDVGSSALQRSLFGDRGTAGRSYSPARRAGYTPYNTVSQGVAVQKYSQPAAPKQIPSDMFGEIVVETRGEAQEVMDKIANVIETYGMACVADLKSAVGLSPTITDEKFGWVGMGGTDIRRVGGNQPGYLLLFPNPEELP